MIFLKNEYVERLNLPITSLLFLRLKAEEEREKKEDEKARREFIKQEYLRRKQLKLMEDMDAVIKPRHSSTKQKKPRPKSMHRDSVESPRVPPRAAGKPHSFHSGSSF